MSNKTWTEEIVVVLAQRLAEWVWFQRSFTDMWAYSQVGREYLTEANP